MIFAVINKTRVFSGFLFGVAWLIYHGNVYENIWQVNGLEESAIAYQKLSVTGKVLTPPQILKNTSLQRPEITNTLSSLNSTKPRFASSLSSMQSSADEIRFVFLIEYVDGVALKQPIKTRLKWRKASERVEINQRWQFYLKLKPVHGYRNAGGFSYATWLRQQGIHATGYILPTKQTVPRAKEPLPNKQSDNSRNKNLLLEGGGSLRQALINRMLLVKQFNQNEAYNDSLDKNSSTTDNAEGTEKNAENTDKNKDALSSLIFALSFGERSQLTQSQWHILSATGTQHLIAISGLHIGIVALGVYFLINAFLKWFPWSMVLNSDMQKRLVTTNHLIISLVLSLVAAVFYAYLAGFTLPTQRALIMLSVVVISKVLSLTFRPSTLLLVSVFLIVTITPFSIFSVSFWLSIYAVIVIFLMLWRAQSFFKQTNAGEGLTLWERFRAFFLSLLIIQTGLSLAMLPIVAFVAGEISVIAFLANIVAVPLMSFIVIPICLIALITALLPMAIAVFFYQLALSSLEIPWTYLTWISVWQSALVSISNAQWLILCFIALCLWAIYFVGISPYKLMIHVYRFTRSGKTRNTIFALCILGLCGSFRLVLDDDYLAESFRSTNSVGSLKSTEAPFNAKEKSQSWQIHMLDVGQGLAVLIEKNNRFILYDTGAKYPSGFSLANAVIIPYLNHRGVDSLDYLILSHADNDHAGGLYDLMLQLKIDKVLTNQAYENIVRQSQSQSQSQSPSQASQKYQSAVNERLFSACNKETSFLWQDLTFDILSPAVPLSTPKAKTKATAKTAGAMNLPKISRNDSSCVVRISDEKHAVLLTGDISQKVEKALINQHGDLTANILVVPHHGSLSSSNEAFLNAVNPELGLVSAGYLNRWKMPQDKVRKRYKNQQIELLETAELGMVSVYFNAHEYQVKSFRNDVWPYWFSQ